MNKNLLIIAMATTAAISTAQGSFQIGSGNFSIGNIQPISMYRTVYKVHDLGLNSRANDINDQNVAVGVSGGAALAWTFATGVPAATILGSGEAYAINEYGEIVGGSGGSGFRWKNNSMTTVALAELHGISGSGSVLAIDSSKKVYVLDQSNNLVANISAQLNNGLIDYATMNEKGEVTGTVNNQASPAFWWQASGMTPFGASFANDYRGAFNNNGIAALSGMRWSLGGNTQVASLGQGNYTSTITYGMNDANVSVGVQTAKLAVDCATIWAPNGNATPIQSQLHPNYANWVIAGAKAINNRGWIIAEAYPVNGVRRDVVLEPVRINRFEIKEKFNIGGGNKPDKASAGGATQRGGGRV